MPDSLPTLREVLQDEVVEHLTFDPQGQSRRAAAGRAQLLANSRRRGIGRFPRKCKLRGPPLVTCGVRVHFAGA